MCWLTLESPGVTVPSRSDLIKKMRPRGLSFSSSRFKYVGHAWRQKPQCTHALIPGSASASGVPGRAQPGIPSGGSGSGCATGGGDAVKSVAKYSGVQNIQGIVRLPYTLGQRIRNHAGRYSRPNVGRKFFEDDLARCTAVRAQVNRRAQGWLAITAVFGIVDDNDSHHHAVW